MAWAATTVATDPARKDGQVISFPMADNITIFKGDMVRIIASGYVLSGTAPAAGDMFAGIAMETVSNTDSGHAAGTKSILVDTEGTFAIPKATAGIADVGTLLYIDDDADQSAAAVQIGSGGLTHDVLVGSAVGLVYDETTVPPTVSTTKLRVKLLSLQQIAT
jgi:predicted RecA/RadA family phage recombinase